MEAERRSHKSLAQRTSRSSKRHGWRSLFVFGAWANRASHFFRDVKHADQKYLKVEQDVREFIQNELLFGEDISFADEDSFLEGGLIDSTGILELVSFLECRYNFTVYEDELQPENLDSVSRLGKYVRAKCGLGG
jgi:acyl carrier protein